jgi:hypothetical protein
MIFVKINRNNRQLYRHFSGKNSGNDHHPLGHGAASATSHCCPAGSVRGGLQGILMVMTRSAPGTSRKEETPINFKWCRLLKIRINYQTFPGTFQSHFTGGKIGVKFPSRNVEYATRVILIHKY